MVTKINMFTCVACIVLFALFAAVATAGPYAISAHGDAEAGVDRTNGPSPMPDDYKPGNCAHCHEQHASIGGVELSPIDNEPSSFALFTHTFNGTVSSTSPAAYSQSSLLCFYCHTSSGSYQTGGSMTNHDYSETFAGYTGSVNGILEQFNQISTGGSNHDLYSIWYYMNYEADINTEGDAINDGWFTSKSDPCTACHNPHLARSNRLHLTESTYATISRTTEHDSQWGDEDDEQMSDYSSIYEAPFYYSNGTRATNEALNLHEPAGVPAGIGSSDGTLTPDYNDFCLDCHAQAIGGTAADGRELSVMSFTLGRRLTRIDWTTEKHGVANNATTVISHLPYGVLGGYVLSCMDCHEAHGSPNAYLVRRSVNGLPLDTTGTAGDARGNQCMQCHKDDAAMNQGNANDWKFQHHGSGTASPYRGSQEPDCGCHNYDGQQTGTVPIPCEICHYHGAIVPNPNGLYPSTVTPKAPYPRVMF